ncbi:hypothetical protein [Mangrovibacillus cuniculi]|uniref:Uncharacterized protein n=1 Tax=Mangrovibacillus cuniculi TaxID=2593652 RepID=A0A7S8CAV0_9BACI|nr:hypothetical protein [Mangrovibacillus cuniculi]QPC46589.1 hypothetical protein G8O30_06225 [Mangrovibacillus cuniculi]
MSSLYYYWKQYIEHRTKVAAITAVAFSVIITISIYRQLQDSILFTSILLSMAIVVIIMILRTVVSTVSMPLRTSSMERRKKICSL